VVGMADPSSEGKMVAPPHLSNKRMRQHDEVGVRKNGPRAIYCNNERIKSPCV
jgi:hypothetical protein